VLILSHYKDPAVRASQHTSAADFKMDPASWNKLTEPFAAVTEMYFNEAEWLHCEQNDFAIARIASIVMGPLPSFG